METKHISRIPDAREPQRGLTFDDVWAALMEDRLQMQKSREDFDRIMQKSREDLDHAMRESREDFNRAMRESSEKFDRELQKSREDFDHRFEKVEKIIGRLGNRMGEVMEWLMTPTLNKKFNKWGYTFVSMRRKKVFRDEKKQFVAEVDVFLENGKYALAVEVKTNLGADDIKEHAQRMATIRRYADAHGDERIFLGAVAAPYVEKSLRKAAYRAGFFVIEPSEESVEVIVPDGFKPKEW